MTAPLYVGRQTPALERLRETAEALGALVERVVFIGGAIAPLLQTHPVSPRVRPTRDVDGVALTASYADFHALQDELRRRGFRQRASDPAPTGHAHRWQTPAGGIFDLVPAGRHLGSSGNPLDEAAVESALRVTLARGNVDALVVRHADAPTFLALKWAAFGDRGAGDVFASHDVEDILAVIAARPSLPDEHAHAPPLVQSTTSAMANALLEDLDVLGELLHAHVAVASSHDVMVVHQQVLERLRRLATGSRPLETDP